MGSGKVRLTLMSDTDAAYMPMLIFPTAWHGAVRGRLHCSRHLRGSGRGKPL